MTESNSTKTTSGRYQAVVKDRLIFDSHEYVKRMTNGGFSEQQAEALAAEQADLLNSLATRQDIEAVRKEIEVSAQTLRKEMGVNTQTLRKEMGVNTQTLRKEMGVNTQMLRKEIEVSAQTLKVEMIKWMTWYFLSGLAVMVAVLKLT